MRYKNQKTLETNSCSVTGGRTSCTADQESGAQLCRRKRTLQSLAYRSSKGSAPMYSAPVADHLDIV